MKTSSEVTFTLRRLSLAYHSIPVSNICHQGNPCRGILLLLNCAVTEMPWNRRHRNYLHFANSFKKEEKERHQSGSVTTLILHRSSQLSIEKNINVVLRGGGGGRNFSRIEFHSFAGGLSVLTFSRDCRSRCKMAVVGTIFSLLVFFVSCTNSARPSNPDLFLQKDGASLAALGAGVPLWANVSKQCEYSVGNLTVPLLEKCEYLVLYCAIFVVCGGKL